MKPLVVLLGSFVIALFVTRGMHGGYDLALSGRIAMAIMLVFTAMGHFAFTNGMTMMIPPFVPYKKTMVYLTGIFEILAGIALLVSTWQVITAWALIIFFILLLPANIYAAINTVDHEKAAYSGKGTAYLWFRVPLQLFFIVWVYFSALY